MQSSEFEPATVPAAATTVQMMVKDFKKSTRDDGWVGLWGASLTASQWTKLNTRPVSLAMKPVRKGVTTYSRDTRLKLLPSS